MKTESNKFLEGLKKLVLANHALINEDEAVARLRHEPNQKNLKEVIARITTIEAEFAAFKALLIEEVNSM